MAPDDQRLELLIDLRRYKEAEEYARECLANDPNWAHGYSQLARLFVNDDILLEAFDAAKTGVAKDVQSPFAHSILAYVCLERGDYTQAKRSVLEALRLAPYYSWAHYLHTRIYQEQNDFPKMRDTAIQALKLFPHDEWLLHQKGWAEKGLREYTLAFATAEEGIRLFPNSPIFWFLRGTLHCELADTSTGRSSRLSHRRLAEEALREAVRLDPGEKAYRDNREINLMLWRWHYTSYLLAFLGVFWIAMFFVVGWPRHPGIWTGDSNPYDFGVIVAFIAVPIIFFEMTVEDDRVTAFDVVPLGWFGVPYPSLTQRQRRRRCNRWLIGIGLIAMWILLAVIRNNL